MSEYESKLHDLKFAQARAQGALKGHVTFMLNMHELGVDTEIMWVRLRQYSTELAIAEQTFNDHLFSMEKMS